MILILIRVSVGKATGSGGTLRCEVDFRFSDPNWICKEHSLCEFVFRVGSLAWI